MILYDNWETSYFGSLFLAIIKVGPISVVSSLKV